jgi:two-component system response regulator NreC
MPGLQETTVVLAVAHDLEREVIAALCTQHGLRVVGQCSDGAAAVEMITEIQPDIALLDTNLPVLAGIEVIRRLRGAGCTTKLIILSTSRQGAMVTEAIRAGADAYLLKDGPSRHLLDAINFSRDGGIYISPSLKGAGFFSQGETRRDADPLASLSPREMEVFSLLVNGRRSKDIADLLEISTKTVDTYRASLMCKLNVHDLVGLVKFAIARNLKKDEDEIDEDDSPLVPKPRGPRPTLGPLSARARPEVE